jgi:hypothetical protein
MWTAVGLTRAQFATILALSIGLFLVVGGPVWRHLREPHLTRIGVGYGVIPAAVAVALYRNHGLRPLPLLGGSVVIALVKLVATAGLLIAFALSR